MASQPSGVRTWLPRHRVLLSLCVALVVLPLAALATLRLTQHAKAANIVSVTDCSTFGSAFMVNTFGWALATYHNGDFIRFDCGGTITVPATITINNTVGIFDNTSNTIILDGGHSSSATGVPIFIVNGNGNLSLRDMILQHGYSAVSGGAIQNHGTLAMSLTYFLNNTSAQDGGAIENHGSLSTEACFFYSNTAARDGGAIHNAVGGTVRDYFSDFGATSKGNTAVNGGAIANDGTLNVKETRFSSNQANSTSGYGGAITTAGPINGTDGGFSAAFSGNSAAYGGGIANRGASVVLTNAGFAGNTAINGGGLFNQTGGTVSLNGVSYYADFSGDKATNEGGGIYNGGKVDISAGALHSNNANSSGGGLYNASGGIASLNDMTIQGNTVGSGGIGGGAVFGEAGSTLTITDSEIDTSKAPEGGALDLKGGTTVLNDVTLSANQATTNGGAIFNKSSLTITYSTFTNNTAVAGGGIYATNSAQVNGSLLANDTGAECAGSAATTGDYTFSSDGTCGNGSHDLSGNAHVGNLNYDGYNTTNIDTSTIFTVPLLNGSPAIDAIPGGSALCPASGTVDARNVPRPQGAGCDMGAYELAPPSVTLTTPANNANYVYGQKVPAAYTCAGNSNIILPSIACSGTIANGADIPTTTIGSNTFTATATDSASGYVVSATHTYQVNQGATQTTLNIPHLVVGVPATLTIVVAPIAPATGTPTGTVTLTSGTTTLGTATLSGGKTTFSYTPTSISPNQALTATYGGDTNFTGSTVTQAINVQQPTTTTLTGVQDTVFGQPLVLQATVTGAMGTPNGTVSLLDGTTVVASATLANGQATLTISLAAGTHHLAVRYNGDANDLTSASATQTQTVATAMTTTMLSSALNPTVAGQLVQLRATVAAVAPSMATPSGSVTFLDGTTTLGTATLSNGIAAFATAKLTVGTHHLTARMVANADFLASTSAALSQTVSKLPPTQGTSAVRFAQGTTLGSVDVAIDGKTVLPNIAIDSVTSYLPLAAGSHQVTVFGPSGSGTVVLTTTITVPDNGYLTVALTGAPASTPSHSDAHAVTTASSLTATVFTDDLVIVPNDATVRVYDLADTLGTLQVSLGGSISAPPPRATPYYPLVPGTRTVTLTPSTSGVPALQDALAVQGNQVYSIFVFNDSQVANTVTAGIPSGLPQTGSAPHVSRPNGWLIVLVALVALVTLGGGGAWLWRRTRRAQ